MTVNDYIQQKFQSFSIHLSETDLLDMCLNAKISGEDEMNKELKEALDVLEKEKEIHLL